MREKYNMNESQNQHEEGSHNSDHHIIAFIQYSRTHKTIRAESTSGDCKQEYELTAKAQEQTLNRNIQNLDYHGKHLYT